MSLSKLTIVGSGVVTWILGGAMAVYTFLVNSEGFSLIWGVWCLVGLLGGLMMMLGAFLREG